MIGPSNKKEKRKRIYERKIKKKREERKMRKRGEIGRGKRIDKMRSTKW